MAVVVALGLAGAALVNSGESQAVRFCTFVAAKAVTGTTVKAGSCPSYPFDPADPCPWGTYAYKKGSHFGTQHEVLVCVG